MAALPFISVVDDDEPVRESLRGFIRSIGFVVKVFASADEFLKSADVNDTDCLILDVRMPVMNGLELQTELVATGRRIPVIFITAHGDAEAKSNAIKNGAVDYLFKPFSEESLLNAIQAALSLKGVATNERVWINYGSAA